MAKRAHALSERLGAALPFERAPGPERAPVGGPDL